MREDLPMVEGAAIPDFAASKLDPHSSFFNCFLCVILTPKKLRTLPVFPLVRLSGEEVQEIAEVAVDSR